MRKRLACLVLGSMLLVAPVIALAHSGRTDSNGGHYNRKTGVYHYHNGGSGKSSSSSSPSESTGSSSSAAATAATEVPAPKPTIEPVDDVLIESDFPITKLSPRQHIKALQAVLMQLGDLSGAVDGEFGKQTIAALTAAAARNGENATDECGYALFLKLMDEAGDLDDAA